MTYEFPQFERFIAFVIERHAVYRRREAGQPAPWTDDKILQEFRFCNVYRELDRVTEWITRFWREPYHQDPDLWFAMVIARLVNYPMTLAQLGYPIPWDKTEFLRTMLGRRKEGLQVFGGAYIISTGGQPMDKAKYLANYVLDPMWAARKNLQPKVNDTLLAYHNRLMQFDGMGSFMAGQVVADIKYVEPLHSAKDWWTFAASGPGSRRGMAYLMGMDPRLKWREHEWRDALKELSELVGPRVHLVNMPRIHAQDLQNCLCEFSKYRRTQLGTGRPKQKFAPHTEK